MNVTVADHAGMCFGVRRALDIACQAARDAQDAGKTAWVIGQLVHNRQVSAWLSDMGIGELTEEDLPDATGTDAVYIVPSHGRGPQVNEIARAYSIPLVDAVCPFVRQALEAALAARKEGYLILIYGSAGHDEVNGYRLWLGAGCLVVDDYRRELEGRVLPAKLAVMTQTTADREAFDRFVDWLREGGHDPLVINSVCKATAERREAAEALALLTDAMLVIGGANSANTANLVKYCKKYSSKTYWIESSKDIDFRCLYGIKSIGITAGASTPDWIIKEVVDMMEEFKGQDLEGQSTEALQEDSREADFTQQGEAEAQADEAAKVAEETVAEAEDTQPAVVEAAEEAVAQEAAPPAWEAPAYEPPAYEASSEAPLDEPSAEPEAEAALPDEAVQDALQRELAEQEALQREAEEREAAQRELAEKEAEANYSELVTGIDLIEFHPGDIIKGTVVKISSDEVLVDIGYKSEGIIPVYELAFTKVDPSTVVSVGDEISVEVMKEDRDGNLVLSRKNALFEEKIDLLEDLFENGSPIEATVIDVVKGGLLVDVGMRGFVPASHVERGFVKDLSEYLHKTLRFKILELNRSGRKVILSRKTLLEEEYQIAREAFWSNIEEGQTKKGIVKRLTDFGAFVDIGGCDGLLHVSEMGWGKVGRPSDVVSINDEIDVYVLKVDRDKEKVSLSLKKLIPNPWDLASEKYQVGSIYTGKVMRGAAFGAFIQLEPSLEGLAHISQLARFRVNKVEDVLVEGMEVPVKVLDIDLEKKRISLSVKEAIDLPKLVKEDEVDKAQAGYDAYAGSADEETIEAFTETGENAGAGTVGEALGAMAGIVAEAISEAAAGAAAEAEAEAEPETAAAAADEAKLSVESEADATTDAESDEESDADPDDAEESEG